MRRYYEGDSNEEKIRKLKPGSKAHKLRKRKGGKRQAKTQKTNS